MAEYLGKVDDSYIELFDEKGASQRLGLVGVFKIDNRYYIVVKAEEDGKEENIMYRVEKRQDGSEYIQVITDKEEWKKAYDAWVELSYEAMRVENDKKI